MHITITIHCIVTHVGNGSCYIYHHHHLQLLYMISVLSIDVLSIGNKSNEVMYFLTKIQRIFYFEINYVGKIIFKEIFYTINQNYNSSCNKILNTFISIVELWLHCQPKDSTFKVIIFGEIDIIFSYITIFQFLKSVYQYG